MDVRGGFVASLSVVDRLPWTCCRTGKGIRTDSRPRGDLHSHCGNLYAVRARTSPRGRRDSSLRLEWLLALIGLGFVLCGGHDCMRVSNALYIGMGWLGLFFFSAFIRQCCADWHWVDPCREASSTRRAWPFTAPGGRPSPISSGTSSCWRGRSVMRLQFRDTPAECRSARL